ncbi:uncharacterized protein HD556DRAFT_1440128 [Suillus plorans]|uniref:DUF6533 domain-containing protein n=1 Tax=Suillus plorans TaxID=116603 RepID=A0A9P7DM95_9AGAM|nr:uncharacterized protein HD556DRAFT_1440128 [Suillus plorans]KAG1798419.1 hypothetical protein HD556DRAFT_1440128 [Suillus plorans]
MTLVSNDPSSWPIINSNIHSSYFSVAIGVVVVYDWVLTLGQEIELIWRQRWSLITVLYLVIRYVGIPYYVVNILAYMPLVPKTEALIGRAPEVLILSGTYTCDYEYEENAQLLISMLWMLYTIWEVLALCLSVRVAVKHFHDLRRLGLSRSIIGDCFRVLMESHVLYFASFVCVSCIQFVILSPELQNPSFIGTQIFGGIREFVFGVQLFVLGPRLVLSVREYHANLVAESDAETSINSIVFQERVHIPTSSTV